MNEFYVNLLKAGITVVFLLLIDFIVEFLLTRKIKDKKTSLKLRVALRYVLVFFFLFFMAKIWVEGFGYLLTIIGVIAAALTITQKEYLMNFVGWLIIMWRDLFVEGDFIEISKYTGYVDAIGPLYFSLEEASDLVWGDRTGRIIKIPNSLIAVNPVIRFSPDKLFVETKLSFTFTFKSNLEKIEQLIFQMNTQVEKILKQQKGEWSKAEQRAFGILQKQDRQKPQFLLRIHQDKPSGIQLKVRFLSLNGDRKEIEDTLCALVMEAVNESSDLVLTVVT